MSRRDQIRMTEAEVEQFLGGRRTMTVATVGPDGQPHLVAMWYGFLDGAPAFETYAKSQKVANLRRDPRITCLVEAGEEYAELKGVQLIGQGAVLDDPEPLRRTAESVVSRYFDFAAGDEATRIAVEGLMRKRVAVRIDVEKVVSWDHAKLGGGF